MQGERNRKTNLSPTGQLRPLRSNSVISNLSVPLLPLAATPRRSSGGPAWTFKKSTSDFGIDRGLRGFTRHKGLSVGSGVRRGSPGLASVTASPGTSGANRNAVWEIRNDSLFRSIVCPTTKIGTTVFPDDIYVDPDTLSPRHVSDCAVSFYS